MLVKRWVPSLQTYVDYETIEGSVMHIRNLHEIVKCAKCGNDVEYGYCYTSKFIHLMKLRDPAGTTPGGLEDILNYGFAVCPRCHAEEMKEAEGWQ